MEKRLLMALLLSFFVLAGWQLLNPAPDKPIIQPEMSESVGINEDVDIPEENQQIFSSNVENNLLEKGIEEKVEVLENEKIKAEFSNMGGVLKKVTIKEFNEELPLDKILEVDGFGNVVFRVENVTNNRIVYVGSGPGIQIVKEYSLVEDDYLINSKIKIKNTSGMSKKEKIQISGFSLDISRLDNDFEKSRDRTLLEYNAAHGTDIFRKTSAFKFSEKEVKKQDGDVLWVGFRNRYFCAIIKPEFETDGFEVNPESDKLLTVSIKSEEKDFFSEETIYFEHILFFGPQKLDLLKSYDLGFEKIMVFFRPSFFDWIAKLIYKLMILIHKVIPNWGVCIIVVSFVIYGAMYPLTMKGMMSMKKMQALQPRLAKLKDENKNNPQKMNKEMMELYREHKINPFGGCFPLLFQMPVFVGLYQVLWRSVSLKGADFLWIKDLSEPDRLFMLPHSLPLIGNEFNILPIIMMVVMVFQQKISSKNMVVTDPAQVAQQKMMMTIFPVFIGFIFYKFASGLTLYFTFFYLLSTFTQWKMSKAIKVV